MKLIRSDAALRVGTQMVGVLSCRVGGLPSLQRFAAPGSFAKVSPALAAVGHASMIKPSAAPPAVRKVVPLGRRPRIALSLFWWPLSGRDPEPSKLAMRGAGYGHAELPRRNE